jgi:hypothetical protein
MNNYYRPLAALDRNYAYLQWNLNSTANGYVCEMMADNDTNYIK